MLRRRMLLQQTDTLWLYKDGEEFTDVTGGWGNPATSNTWNIIDSVDRGKTTLVRTKNATNLTVNTYGTNGGGFGSFCVNKPIDFSSYSKLIIDCGITKSNATNITTAYLFSDFPNPQFISAAIKSFDLTSGVNELDISDVQSAVCLDIACSPHTTAYSSVTIIIKRVYLKE